LVQRVGVSALVVAIGWAGSARAQDQAGSDAAPLRWYKGNTHTHTLNSDGDSAPDEVARWYREHGYQFLVLSDHNYLTEIAGLNAVLGAEEQFLLIRGEEVTDAFQGKSVHVNALDPDGLVEPQHGASVADVLQRNVNAIRRSAGVPHVNHPNFEWALTVDDLARLENDRLFEIFNGHPMVNNEGGGGRPGLEEIWDRLLTGGKVIYGIAVDDAHQFKQPWNRKAARPGQGWVMVRAARLTPADILGALERGDFYASTGIVLDDVRVTAGGIEIRIKPDGQTKYRVQFIGEGGKVQAEAFDSPAVYTFDGTERYVRARVQDSNGWTAWTQPVYLR
jgi:hypothetical protein